MISEKNMFYKQSWNKKMLHRVNSLIFSPKNYEWAHLSSYVGSVVGHVTWLLNGRRFSMFYKIR